MSIAVNRETLMEAIQASIDRIFNAEIDEAMQRGNSVDKTVKEIEGILEWREQSINIVQKYFDTHPEKEES